MLVKCIKQCKIININNIEIEKRYKMLYLQKIFVQCIDVLETKHHTEIKCKLGLWSVSGSDYQSVEREAYHYWKQYYYDGGYSSLPITTEKE